MAAVALGLEGARLKKLFGASLTDAGAVDAGVELDADGAVAVAAGGAPKEKDAAGLSLAGCAGFSACFSAGLGTVIEGTAGAAAAEGAGAGVAAGGWKVICGGGVGVGVLAAPLASANLRSLSFVIAAASKSCFSHFEYVFVTAGFAGLGSGEVATD